MPQIGRDPVVPISILESGSDIWPKGHLRLLSLDLKFKEQEGGGPLSIFHIKQEREKNKKAFFGA
jgi:hypothetical protein